MKTKADLMMMKVTLEVTKLRQTASGFERAAKDVLDTNADLVSELSTKYNVDLKNPNVTIDDITGMISLINPEEGYPYIKKKE
jgi:hypothetical protein